MVYPKIISGLISFLTRVGEHFNRTNRTNWYKYYVSITPDLLLFVPAHVSLIGCLFPNNSNFIMVSLLTLDGKYISFPLQFRFYDFILTLLTEAAHENAQRHRQLSCQW
jgi:hypothetical protein